MAPLRQRREARDKLIGKYRRFVPVAHAFAAMSKYAGLKVGCIILGQDFEVRASGWNGAPRGSKADEDRRLVDRDERLAWACHAEINAIANAARSGTALNGATMVVTCMPCMSCAKAAVQAGIIRVVCPAPDAETLARWASELSRELFKECGVDLVEFDTIE